MDGDHPIEGKAQETPWGLGTASALTSGTRDVRLVQRALQECWPISVEARQALVARLEKIVQDPATKLRSFHAAAKALMAISRINLSSIGTAIAAQQHEELVQRLDELEKRVQQNGGK
jgi:hypothetical protein